MDCEIFYDIVACIPAGRVLSYGQLALMAGRPGAARMAARAMSHAPHDRELPCHRVVNQSGRLSPPEVFGGEGVQRAALEAEGVIFKHNGCIDMNQCGWIG